MSVQPMPPEEPLLEAPMWNRLLLYAHTIRHLRPRQTLNRISRKFKPPPRIGEAGKRRDPSTGLSLDFLPRSVTLRPDGRFRLLNLERRVPPSRYACRNGTLLWDYHFHYFDGLLGPMPDNRAKSQWIRDWLAHVPVGATPAWDPYPVSRRIQNWVKFGLACPEAIPAGFDESLRAQATHLEKHLEYHLGGNHLLANATALAFAGIWFGDPRGERWWRRSLELLEGELAEQFLEDGAHFELSPTYHSIVLEDLLDLLQLSSAFGMPVPERLRRTSEAASRWLSFMRRPDGRVALLNDAAYGQASTPGQLLDYGSRVLEQELGEPISTGLRYLQPSGYFRYQVDRLWLLGDVGGIRAEYQPGHTHCDLLSFVLCWDEVPIVVDTGTSTYERNARRLRERGTAAHNTIQIGTEEQSEIWAAFRIARRASVEEVSSRSRWLQARIRAFPPDWSELRRTWRFDEERIEIVDEILEGSGGRMATARLHFHPEVTLTGHGNSWMANDLHVEFSGARSVRAGTFEYAPDFNVRTEGRCLEIDFLKTLRSRIFP